MSNPIRKSYGDPHDLNLKSIIAISRAAQILHRNAAKTFKDGGLTLAQFSVLEALYHKGDMRICELIEKTLSTGGNMTVVIDNLVKLGMVHKLVDPQDRRASKIRLSDTGSALIEEIFPKHLSETETIFQPLSHQEKETLISLLKKLTQYSKEETTMSHNALFESRRSVNFFDPSKGLDQNTLENIINLAVTAPSAFNLQPWEVIVVKSEEGKKKLFDASFGQPKILEAPVTLVILGDREGYGAHNPEWSVLEGIMGKEAVDGYVGFAGNLYGSTEDRKTKFAESNAGLLAMSIMYAAENYGVASHAMSGIDFDGIKKAFDIEDSKEVVMTIALGYFDESKQLYPRRARRGYGDVTREV